MPLTQPQRIALARLLGHLRDDWHDAGIHDACLTLAAQTADAAALCAQAATRAGDHEHRTPLAITWPLPQPLEHRPNTGEHCDVHDVTTGRRPDGILACCWTEQLENIPAPVITRKPIPDHIREQIHAHVPSPPALVPSRAVDRGQRKQARAELDARRANIPGPENPPADPTDPVPPMAGQTRKADR